MRLSRRAAALENQLVWLLSPPRSGSTWLLNMLCRQSGFVKIDEPLVGAHLGIRTNLVTVNLGPQFAGPALTESQAARATYFFSDEYASAWEPALRSLLLERFSAEATAKAPAVRNPFVVIKEPHGSEGASLIFRALPKARLIFLVRDARDVADSVLAMWQGEIGADEPARPTDDDRLKVVSEAAQAWVTRVQSIRHVFNSLPEAQRFFVRYEDLRPAPVPHLLRIFEWLGVEVAPADIQAVADTLAFEKVPEEKRGPGRFHRAATPGLWRTSLREPEHAAIVSIAGDLLAELGYDPLPATDG